MLMILKLRSPAVAARYMHSIQRAGDNYGLSFNWARLEVLPVRCEAAILKPDGTPIVEKDSIVYLGSVICKDGTLGPELARRLGAARSEFDKLSRVWSRSALGIDKQLRIFETCVLSRLTYCLHTAYLNKRECQRLDAFQAGCLRKILGIPHSYISRVTNQCVLEKPSVSKLSSTLLKRQLTFLGHVAKRPDDPVRSLYGQAFFT